MPGWHEEFNKNWEIASDQIICKLQLFQLMLSDQSLKLKGIFKAAASSST